MPCIQTLGHLGQMLQWPKFGTLRDTAEVLLAESAETYAFIEKVKCLGIIDPRAALITDVDR